MRGLRRALCLVFPRYCPLRVRYNAGGVSPIQPVYILRLLSGDAVILRSEPSSRAALMGEQPNPWDLSLPPLLVGQDYTFTIAVPCHHGCRRCEPCDRPHMEGPISPSQSEELQKDQSLRETNPWIIA